MKKLTKNIFCLFTTAVVVTPLFSCRGKKYAGINDDNSDSAMLEQVVDDIGKSY
jgi:hypothetical protein